MLATCLLLCVAPIQSRTDEISTFLQSSDAIGSLASAISRSSRVNATYIPQASERAGAGPTYSSQSVQGGRGGTKGYLGKRRLLPAQRRGQRVGGPAYVAPAGSRGAVPRRVEPGEGDPSGLRPGDVDLASKWDLIGFRAGAGVPQRMLQGLTGGPLTDEEAEALARALTTGNLKDPLNDPSTSDASRILASPADPELQQLHRDLDLLVPIEGAPRPGLVDTERLRAWFLALDLSRDAAISFLEWRDHTGLGIEAFRRIDGSGEGLVSYEEFARAMVLRGIRGPEIELDPNLAKWAAGRDSQPGGTMDLDVAAPDFAGWSDEDLLRRVRAELALTGRQRQAPAAEPEAAAKKEKERAGERPPQRPRPAAPDRRPPPPKLPESPGGE